VALDLTNFKFILTPANLAALRSSIPSSQTHLCNIMTVEKGRTGVNVEKPSLYINLLLNAE
jgi:hypothetical protein